VGWRRAAARKGYKWATLGLGPCARGRGARAGGGERGQLGRGNIPRRRGCDASGRRMVQVIEGKWRGRGAVVVSEGKDGSAGVREAGANAKAPAVRARSGLLEGHKVLPLVKAGSSAQAGAVASGGAITRNAAISTCKRGSEWVGAVQFPRQMVQVWVARDAITYSTLSSTCEKGGEGTLRPVRVSRAVSGRRDQHVREGRQVDCATSACEQGGDQRARERRRVNPGSNGCEKGGG
jgi:hypothetical protein